VLYGWDWARYHKMLDHGQLADLIRRYLNQGHGSDLNRATALKWLLRCGGRL